MKTQNFHEHSALLSQIFFLGGGEGEEGLEITINSFSFIICTGNTDK